MCGDLDCLRGIFTELNELESLEFDLRLARQFEELFQRGLLEQMAQTVPTRQMANILGKLFCDLPYLSALLRKYFPFHDAKNVAKLSELARWNIRKRLAHEKMIISHVDIPWHLIKILKFERPA